MTKDLTTIFKQQQNLFKDSIKMTKKHSSSFYFAFKPLSIAKRNSIYALYHFLRLLDDSVDNCEADEFYQLKSEWEQFKAGTLSTNKNPWPALELVFHNFDIDYQWIDDMIDGQTKDFNKLAIITEQDLDDYCYDVAGTVGLMLMPILNDNSTFNHQAAINVGKAMQLTNILRDIKEDALADKFYLPQQLLSNYQIEVTELKAITASDNLVKLIEAKTTEALNYYRQVGLLLPSISDTKSRLSLKLAVEVYKGILLEIVKKDYQVLKSRIYVSDVKKVALLTKLTK
ncbi:phytoene/squalene synthase family protein [Holzapfeliella floricola]|uniref:Farnesyl-diphosphate farnesyltransferase n=1 Tax=Holzapfeliella floricola DSM 23037 = JCM 16512 TaxID=1423744 RepID=A0A0R2DJT4_9LACO|nr:phytoene/squalene synthase family protein [Holzapfeliella floricola]KRN04345.1 farnesyl-diphosphate farnesyltransferase [Holzapfeliella floricola DSM 23037 = JCM 16512]